MMVQSIISEKAFGYKSLPGTHYVKAMLTKLGGGNYIDCVKAYYGSKKKHIEEEIGDLLFAVTLLGYHYGVNAENALTLTNNKFIKRFKIIEKELKPGMKENDILKLWNKAKTR